MRIKIQTQLAGIAINCVGYFDNLSQCCHSNHQRRRRAIGRFKRYHIADRVTDLQSHDFTVGRIEQVDPIAILSDAKGAVTGGNVGLRHHTVLAKVYIVDNYSAGEW